MLTKTWALSPFDHGAGHIDPLKAIDPGLVYDIGPQDYFEFLCTQDSSPCKHTLAKNPGNLNYPAISALFPENTHVKSMTLRRTVTNVGPHISSYKVSVSPFKGASVTVQPKTLNFSSKLTPETFLHGYFQDKNADEEA